MKVLLIYDLDGWAFHHIACGLQSYAPDWVDVTIASHEEYYADIREHKPRVTAYDAILAISLCTARPRLPKPIWIGFACHCGFSYDTETLYDFRTLGVNPRRCRKAAWAYVTNEVDWIFACNSQVANAFRAYAPQRVSLLPQGIDTDLFTPRRWREPKTVLTAGWCGQPAPCKGRSQVLRPLITALGPSWRWRINSRTHGTALSPAEMVKWYRNLDLFVCTSTSEGGPLTPFEAASCGVPVLSTDIGSVRDWNLIHDVGLILPEYKNHRDAKRVVTLAVGIMNHWRPTRELSETFRTDIVESRSWKTLAARWFDEIKNVVERKPTLPCGFAKELRRLKVK